MKKAFNLILIGMLLFGMIAAANTGDKEAKELLQAKKKAIYYEIRVDLMEGKITVEQAQARWLKAVEKLNKEEGK